MSKSRVFTLLMALALLAGLVWLGGAARAADAKIEPELLRAMEAEGSGTYWVYLQEQADLSAAADIADWSQRGRFVYDSLRQTAAASQAGLLAYVDGAIERGAATSAESFFIANAVLVTSDLATMSAIAARPEVALLRLPKTLSLPPFEPVTDGGILTLEWGVERVRADEVWADFGSTGEGIVVANIDTGVQYNHPALVNQYRGNLGGGTFDHDFSFYDPSNVCGGAVCDNNGHGSHTMGTMVGDDGGVNQIGVAPGATWIAAKGCESSSCSDFALLNSAEWLLAPCAFGEDPGHPSCDPDMRPHVVNNSWGGGGGDPWYQASVDAWRAAGIFPAFSAGNSGPGSGTIGSPGDYCNVLASGATDINDVIAGFSSRGPGNFPDCTDKPDVSAPGVSVRSSIPTNSYGFLSGTSMASPHTAGCAALLLSIEPTQTYDDLYDALTTTAVDLGAGGFDFTYGYGRIDCYEAALTLSPDFILSASPESQAVCVPDSALYLVDVGQIQGFDDPVTLSANGVPAGYSADFSVNPVIPPGTSDMTLMNTGPAAAGSYAIDIVGVAPTSTHTTTVQLNLFDAAPGLPTLLAPPDGATNVDLVPTFSWMGVPQGSQYHLQIYAAGPTLIYEAFTPDTSHTIDIALDPLTSYTWRVAAINPCDHGPWSDFFSFTTRDVPPILLVDDDDNAPDVRAFYTDALDNLGQVYDLWDTGNSDTEPSYADLLPYDMVIWFTGDEFGGAAGPGGAGEGALGQWLDGGKCLFLSSQDYHYDRGLTSFMQDYLGTQSVTDDNGDYSGVTGQGLVFGGLGPYTLSYPFTDYSDVITGDASSENAWRGNNNNTAGIDKDSGVYRTTFWVYPWEAISTAADREEAMATAVAWCGTGVDTGTLEGTVYDADSGQGIGGATVTADDGGGLPRTTTADANGDYIMTLAVGTYDVTASADDYQSEIVPGIVIITNTTTVQDFFLSGSHLTYAPAAIEEFMSIGDVVTTSVTVTNTGPLDIDWSVSIGNYDGPGLTIPASDGDFPLGEAAPSLGMAPVSYDDGSAISGDLLAPDSPAFGVEFFADELWTFTLDNAESPTPVGGAPRSYYAGDFVTGSWDTLYAVDQDTQTLYAIDTATAASAAIGPMAATGGQTWTGMSYDSSSGVMYATSSDCSNNTLYTVDLNTGAPSVVGTTSGVCIIDIGISSGGQMYGVDIIADSLGSIDKATGAWTNIGSIGFDANFAQGMDFDEETDTLYLAAYNNAFGRAELRIADLGTGNTALVSVIGPGGSAEVDSFGIVAGSAGQANWASAVPDSGTVPANSTATFDVVFDARSLIAVGDYTAELSFSGTFVNDPPVMPLTMHLDCPTCGFLEGSITDWLTGDPLSADIHITGPGGFDVMLSGETYALAVQPGFYDFEVTADGYLPESATVEATQGDTTVTDFALVPAISFLEYAPPEIEEFMDLGDVVTTPVTIQNTGYVTMSFSVSFGGFGGPGLNAPVSLPASDGIFPRGDAAPSLGMAPVGKADESFLAGGLLAPDSPAFGVEFFSDQLWTFTLDNAESPTPVGAAPRSYYAGDFVTGSWDTLYAVDQDTQTLYAIDTTTAASAAVGPMAATGGQTWTGMSYDSSSAVMYAMSSDCSNNTLYTVNLNTGAPTVVGTTAGVCIIDIAVSSSGQMYGVDIIADSLGTINKATGAWTNIGSIGFDANFAQGMDFDEETDTLYLAAYNNSFGRAELRIADLGTGNTALVSVIGPGGSAEVDSFGIVAGSAGATDWVYAVPEGGVVPAGDSVTIDVVFDARSLTLLGDYTAQMNFSGDFSNEPPAMPLTMHVSCPTCGSLDGSIFDDFTGDPLEADIHIVGAGGFEVMLSGDSYDVVVPADLYDITVSADGYFSETANVEALAGQAVTTDFYLVPQVAILEYEPATIEVTVPLGGSAVETLLLHNTGTVPFDFSLSDIETGQPGFAPLTVCPPDAFGYTCTDSTEGDVDYAFEDISGTGTPISLGDDQVSPALPMGFDFDFYGTVYGNAYVSSNGFVGLVQPSSSGCCSGQQLPNPSSPNGLVAGWWEDLDPPEGGSIHYETLGDAPWRTFVVQFTDIQHFPSGNAVTFQFKLFEGSNNIEIHYDTLATDGGNHSIGIENQTGTVGLNYFYGGGAPPATPHAVCFLYPGQVSCGRGAADAAWLSLAPDSGTINPGESISVDVNFDASAVTQTGTYEGQVLFDGTFDNDVPPANIIMHVVDSETLFALDYVYYVPEGPGGTGTLSFYADGTFTNLAGELGVWRYLPSPARLDMAYLNGASCGAMGRGYFFGTRLVGFWMCTDGSGAQGSWRGAIVSGFADGLPTVPMGKRVLPARPQ